MEKMRTLLLSPPDWLTPADIERLRASCDIEYHEVPGPLSEEQILSYLNGHELLLLEYDIAPKLSPGFYAHPAVRALKALSSDVTGMDWASPAAAASIGLPLLHVPNYSTAAVAETILTEALLHAHQRHASYQDQLAGRTPLARQGRMISTSTVGIIGLGDIGKESARLFGALGAKVLCWSRTPREGYACVSLPELFSRCDVLVLCTKTVHDGPDRNVGFINDDLLSLCQDAIFINLSRAELVDPVALRHALDQGNIAGYSIDEPIGVKDLEADPRVHLSPHDGWYTQESLDALRQIWVDTALSFTTGHPINVYVD